MNFSTHTNIDNNGNKKATLLSLLAEVASQMSNEDFCQTNLIDSGKNKKQQKLRWGVTDSNKMTVKQLRSFSATQLLKMFTVLEGDEMKKTFNFQCNFLPGCGARFFSFGSEEKARHLVKQHLTNHLQDLDPDCIIEIPRKGVSSSKRNAKSLKKLAVRSKLMEDDFNTNYLIETSKQENDSLVSLPDPCRPDVKHDHDYHIPLSENVSEYYLERKVFTKKEFNSSIYNKSDLYTGILNSTIKLGPLDPSEGFMSTVSEEVVITTEDDINPIKTSSDLNSNCVVDTVKPQEKKPKGKAKFIGQSAEEREMAVEMIKALRKGAGELECQICKPPRFFTALTTLISHYKSHAGIKPYECVMCKAVFTRQHSLNYHLLIHLNQTRFTCDVCGRKFRHPSHFKEHQRRHTGESPFNCPDCSFRFKTRNTYKRHLKSRHGKLLTQSGTIETLSEEEFKRIRTNPREKQRELDKENSNNNSNTTHISSMTDGIPQCKVMKVLQKGNQQDIDLQGNESMLNASSTTQPSNGTPSVVLSAAGKNNSDECLSIVDTISSNVGNEFYTNKLYVSSIA